MTKPNVLFVLDFLEPGGATRVNQELSKTLDNINVILLSGKTHDISRNFLRLEEEFNCAKKFIYEIKATSNFVLYALNIFKTLHLSFKIFREIKINHIIINFPHSGLGILLNPQSWFIRKTFLFHGAWDLEKKSLRTFTPTKTILEIIFSFWFEIKNKIEYLICKAVLILSNKIVAFSMYSSSLLSSHYKIPSQKITLTVPPVLINHKIPRLARLEILRFKKKYGINNIDTTFLVPSRLEPRKGIHLLIEAIHQLHLKGINNFKILLTGPDFDSNFSYMLFSRCRELGLLNLILFLPAQERKNLLDLYSISDCIIMPSVDLETFGLVTMESLKFSKPVITLPVGATPEHIKHIDINLITATSDPQGLKNTIHWYLKLSRRERKSLELSCLHYYQKTYNNDYSRKLALALFN